MLPFDLRGPLPAHPSTTVLEASAGTGKDVRAGRVGDPIPRRGRGEVG